MSFDWSPFGSGGDSVKFENVGDEIVGKIIAIRTRPSIDKEKGPVPILDIERKDDGATVSMWVDKVDLRRKVAEVEPQVGDMIAVKFTGTEKTDKGSPMKIFAVKHKVGERAAVAPAEPEWDDEPDYSSDPF